MRWFMPSWNGDFRVETDPENPKQTLLITSPKRIATKAGIRDVAPSRFVVEAGLTGGAS